MTEDATARSGSRVMLVTGGTFRRLAKGVCNEQGEMEIAKWQFADLI
jgi:hypothetical protein